MFGKEEEKMITGLILIAIIVVLIIILRESYNDMVLFICAMLLLLSIVFTLMHTTSYLLKGYEYEIFVAERDAFELTLKNAREMGNEYEVAAITKEVAEWNILLAKAKYKKNHWFLSQYIDERVESLEPIK